VVATAPPTPDRTEEADGIEEPDSAEEADSTEEADGVEVVDGEFAFIAMRCCNVEPRGRREGVRIPRTDATICRRRAWVRGG
jgi:hypothetical protein